MRQCFFAYGSFEENQIHFPKIAQFITQQKRAFLKADIYRLSCGFPVVELQNASQLIEGNLLELSTPESYWVILDQLLGVDGLKPEKSLFQRKEVEVMTDNYSKISCQVYCLNPKKLTKKLTKITDGDWKKNMVKQPPIVNLLQDRHKDYIVRLSKTKGRDILPIKLDLYRELLSMELIVDKGRRLALTPLGKEASLFIQ